MGMTNPRIVKAKFRERLNPYQEKPFWFKATIGDANGDILVPGKPGFVYVTDFVNIRHEAFNTVAPTNKLGVLVRVGYDPQDPSRLIVLSLVNPYAQSAIQPVPAHHTSHEWLGSDMMNVYGNQIIPALVRSKDGTDMVVCVYPFMLRMSDRTFKRIAYKEIDLTSHIPVTGARWGLIVANSATGAIEVQDGTPVGSLTVLVAVTNVPAPTIGTVPLAAVTLYASQTAVIQSATRDDIRDLRGWVMEPTDESDVIAYDPADLADWPAGDPGDVSDALDVIASRTKDIEDIGADVVGPAVAVDHNLVMFDGTTGKLVEDSGVATDADGELSEDSDARVPTQKAVKYYIDTHAGPGTITRAGATEDGNLAVWNGPDANSLRDGGLAVPLEDMIFGEDHSAECDGVETEFFSDNIFRDSTLRIFLNGLRQKLTDDYTEKVARTGFDFIVAPFAGDFLLLDYIKEAGVPGGLTVSGPYADSYGALATVILTSLHMHTTNSDGALSPSALAAALEGKGFGALVITDHDEVTADPGGHGMIYVPSNELTPTTGHMLSINSDYVRGAVTDRQTNIDAVIADGGLVFLSHPKWLTGFTQAVMAALTGYHGIEIYNTQVESGASSNGVSNPGFDIVDWDYLLTNVRRNIWGIASDDFHTETAWKFYHIALLHLFTNGSTLADAMDSLEAGNFAAEVSNDGVTPGKPDVSETGVDVVATGATAIRFVGANGVLLEEDAGDTGHYDFVGTEAYVRIEAVGDYTEAFGSALSDQWSVLAGTWNVSGGIVSQSAAGTNRYILRRYREGDFQAQVDVRIATANLNGNSVSLMFHAVDSSRFYVMRLGHSTSGAPTWDNKLCIGKTTSNNLAGTTPLGSHAITPAGDTWYTMKMAFTRATGRIQAKVWATGDTEPDWQIDITSTSWTHGAFGFRCGTGCDYDNLYINGFKTYYQPIPRGDWVA